MVQFYEMKNIGDLKQHCDFKRWYPAKTAKKNTKDQKDFCRTTENKRISNSKTMVLGYET